MNFKFFQDNLNVFGNFHKEKFIHQNITNFNLLINFKD